MRDFLWKVVALSALISLSACTYATYAPALKPVAENGWVYSPDGPNSYPGEVIYAGNEFTVRVSPPTWDQVVLVGPILPVLPMGGSKKHRNIFIGAYSLRNPKSSYVGFDALQLHCSKTASKGAEAVTYELKNIGRVNNVEIVPNFDWSEIATCTLHISLKDGTATVPDLVFNSGTISSYGGLE